MGREHKKRRRMVIRQSQKRKLKLKKLRQAYVRTEDNAKKEQLLAKVFKLAPWLTKEEFLQPVAKIKEKPEDK